MRDVNRPLVLIVDDDPGMRAALRRLLILANLDVEDYIGGVEFFAHATLGRADCICLDLDMPDMSGLEVQTELMRRRVATPIVFLTGAAQISNAVVAMRNGAIDLVEKPFDNEDLIARLRLAIESGQRDSCVAAEQTAILARFGTLTSREREVMDHIVAGRTNKEIARCLGVSHRTIDNHRSNLMEKTAAATLAELVRMRLTIGQEQLAGPREL